MNKYNKTLRYRKHHELGYMTIDVVVFLQAIIFGFPAFLPFLIFKISYNSFLKASDFALLVIIVVYQVLVRPKIYRGEIEAYYRRKYKVTAKAFSFYLIWSMIAIWRFFLMYIFRGVLKDDYFLFLENYITQYPLV